MAVPFAAAWDALIEQGKSWMFHPVWDLAKARFHEEEPSVRFRDLQRALGPTEREWLANHDERIFTIEPLSWLPWGDMKGVLSEQQIGAWWRRVIHMVDPMAPAAEGEDPLTAMASSAIQGMRMAGVIPAGEDPEEFLEEKIPQIRSAIETVTAQVNAQVAAGRPPQDVVNFTSIFTSLAQNVGVPSEEMGEALEMANELLPFILKGLGQNALPTSMPPGFVSPYAKK